MKNKVKQILFMVLVLMMVGFNTLPVAATTDMMWTSNGHVRQEQSNWCWAASTISWLQTRNISRSQTSHVRDDTGGTANITRNLFSINNDFSVLYGIRGNLNFTLGVNTIQNNIRNNRPIFIAIFWHTGGGHAALITGCDRVLSGDNTWIEVMDPANGWQYVRHRTLVTNYRNAGAWRESITF
jgi:hypothetical protein